MIAFQFQQTQPVHNKPMAGVDADVKTLHLHFRNSLLVGPPFKILELQDGNFLVSDELNHRLLQFDPEGDLVWQVGGKGNPLGKFCYPRGFTVYENEIYVCDSWNHRIQVLDYQGHPIRSIESDEAGKPLFDECSDIEIGPEGHLWIIDTGNHCIKVVSRDGRWLRTIGRRLSRAEEAALQASPESQLDRQTQPGFCYPHRFLIQYPFGFCIDDRGNDRLLLIHYDGMLYAEMNTENGSTHFLQAGMSLLWQKAVHLPAAFLKDRELNVLNWRGASFFKASLPCFAETQSQMLQTDSGSALNVLTFDWTTQDIVRYRVALPAGTAADREAFPLIQ